jgi:hypothetical protein
MFKWKSDNTQGSIKNGQSRESGNIGYPRRRKDRNWQHRVHKTKIKKTQDNMCWTPLYANKHK